jgi:recombination associated protein RdgC
MGIVKDPLSFSRFHVRGEIPENFSKTFDEMIRRFAFQQSFHVEKLSGWTSIDSVLDTEFKYANYAVGEYLFFSMRVDKKVIPPSLLKVRVLEEEKKALGESGKKFLARQRKEDIRDKVKLELAGIIPPVPSFFEACWSPRGKIVYFCSLAAPAIEEFKDLFKRSFKMDLSPLTPWDAVPSGPEADDGESKPAPPGRDFLVWLWFRAEERGGKVSLGGRDIEVIFLKRMVLESGEGEYSESVVCQGLNAALDEGKEALRKGKKIREARIRLGADECSWEFTIKADQFLFQSMRMPQVMEMEDESDRDGRLLERIGLIEKAAGIMDELFAEFLKAKASPEWKKNSARYEKWLSRD